MRNKIRLLQQNKNYIETMPQNDSFRLYGAFFQDGPSLKRRFSPQKRTFFKAKDLSLKNTQLANTPNNDAPNGSEVRIYNIPNMNRKHNFQYIRINILKIEETLLYRYIFPQ